ncbi:MAG TPA: ROK family protein [Acidimicrobiales bacterium]|nr:ROK family protein [Acidimicrobiales bacterium]
MSDLALAVDIGGTKLAAAVVDRAGQVLHRAQVPTQGVDDAGRTPVTSEDLWGRLASLVLDVADRTGEHRIVVCGVGCGGPMSVDGDDVSPLNIPQWRSFPLRAHLGELLGVPVFVDNDAKALARGEGWLGAAAGGRNFMAMVVSTGVGGGIVLDGRLLGGRLGNAGHIGHVVVVPDGRRCACGGYGCLEAEASGSAVAAITSRPALFAPPEVVERTGMLVGRAIASVANLLDLPLAVVSGSVALGFGDPFFTAAQQEIKARCGLEFARETTVVPGGLGDRGPLVGAAAVGWAGMDGLV